MKKLLFGFALGAFAACGNGTSKATADSTTVSTDTTTSASGSSLKVDTSSKKNSDTGSMSTPH